GKFHRLYIIEPMAPYSVSGSLRIAAPPARLYGIISDYRNGHPHILPKQFSNLRVESGSGVGAGTTIRFEVTMMGRTDRNKAIVSEPEPGRVLVETNLEPKRFGDDLHGRSRGWRSRGDRHHTNRHDVASRGH